MSNRSSIPCIIAALVIAILCAGPVLAQEEAPPAPERLDIGVYLSPPFVEAEDGNTYSGMAIDLWEMVAEQLDLSFNYVRYPSIRDLVQATTSGEVDAAVTNLTITRARAETLEFTQPWYDAGLRIMVSDQGGEGFGSVFEGLQDAGHIRAYGWLLFVIVLATIGVTFFDRRFDPDFPKRWRDGVAESFYQVMSVATSGRTSRKNLFGWIGRIWQAIWLVIGVAIIAYITSSVTSVMTAVSLTHEVNSLADLPGKTVGVFTGSVSEDYIQELGIASRSYADIDTTVSALQNGRVDAIVGDAPVLEHYAFRHPEKELSVVGNIFHPDKYGFAFPYDSELTLPVTFEILELQEDGSLEELDLRYFGNET